MEIKTRSQLPELLNYLSLTGEGVEIGVQEGFYSHKILSNSNLKTLYSVDVWNWLPDNEVGDTLQEQHDYRYLKTIMRLMEFGTRSVCLKRTSEQAVNFFKDNSLDFVYIDANHDYEGVRKDIEIWWPKAKSGSIFSGHDYLDGWKTYVIEGITNDGRSYFGVKEAVDEFVKENNLKLHILNHGWDKEWPTWYVTKP